jgi:cyanophycinase-like exopeptidase
VTLERPLGRVALHGGGEFLAGDERFLGRLLEASLSRRHSSDRLVPVRVSIVPVAAARSMPGAAVAHGRSAFTRVARAAGLEIDTEAALVVDERSADDDMIGSRLESSDVIYLPGGDPDLVVGVLAGTRAWAAIRTAFARGAVIAGASAGAMGLASRTWTPAGWREGLGLVGGLIVVPHFAGFDREGWGGTVDELRGARLGQLGLDERTGVISGIGGEDPWEVAGEASAHWFPASGEPMSGHDGDRLEFGG